MCSSAALALSLRLHLTPTRFSSISRSRLPVSCNLPSTRRSPQQAVGNHSSASSSSSSSSSRRAIVVGAATFLFLGWGWEGENKAATALGFPEGPLVEEFWDNMRRYALYVLTVSTGVAYAVLKPLVELLKNPISAILLLIVLVGGGYLLSQVLSLMVGVAEFSYDYAN